MKTNDKKREMAYKMNGTKSGSNGGMKHHGTSQAKGGVGERYRQAGDRPFERGGGEKATQANTRGKFVKNKMC